MLEARPKNKRIENVLKKAGTCRANLQLDGVDLEKICRYVYLGQEVHYSIASLMFSKYLSRKVEGKVTMNASPILKAMTYGCKTWLLNEAKKKIPQIT